MDDHSNHLYPSIRWSRSWWQGRRGWHCWWWKQYSYFIQKYMWSFKKGWFYESKIPRIGWLWKGYTKFLPVYPIADDRALHNELQDMILRSTMRTFYGIVSLDLSLPVHVPARSNSITDGGTRYRGINRECWSMYRTLIFRTSLVVLTSSEIFYKTGHQLEKVKKSDMEQYRFWSNVFKVTPKRRTKLSNLESVAKFLNACRFGIPYVTPMMSI